MNKKVKLPLLALAAMLLFTPLAANARSHWRFSIGIGTPAYGYADPYYAPYYPYYAPYSYTPYYPYTNFGFYGGRGYYGYPRFEHHEFEHRGPFHGRRGRR
jgi:hypothetical protein